MSTIPLYYAEPFKVKKNLLAFVNDLAVLAVFGEEAAEFLQGQMTADVRDLENLQPLFSGCCDYKGRVVANFWVLRQEKNFYLLLPSAMLEITRNHLKKFALFSKVSFNPDHDWDALLYSSAEKNINEFNVKAASLPMHTEPAHFLHWFIGRKQEIAAIARTLSNYPKTKTVKNWNDLMILTDFCFIQIQTSGVFVPQMINLDKFKGISFNKGCFLGQEVVARTQHLGQLKRHLHSFYLSKNTPPELGEILTNEQGEEIGQVISVSSRLSENYRILAVIQDRNLDSPIYLPT